MLTDLLTWNTWKTPMTTMKWIGFINMLISVAFHLFWRYHDVRTMLAKWLYKDNLWTLVNIPYKHYQRYCGPYGKCILLSCIYKNVKFCQILLCVGGNILSIGEEIRSFGKKKSCWNYLLACLSFQLIKYYVIDSTFLFL